MEAHNHGVAAAIIQVSSIDDAGNDSALLSSNVEVIRAGGLFNSLRKRTSMTAAEKGGRWRSCGLRRRAPQAVFNDAVQLDGQEETILAIIQMVQALAGHLKPTAEVHVLACLGARRVRGERAALGMRYVGGTIAHENGPDHDDGTDVSRAPFARLSEV